MEGHFVIIDHYSEDLLWLQSETSAKNQVFDDEVPIHFPLSLIVGHIQGQSNKMGKTWIKFFLLIKEFLPDHVNSCKSINNGPCASLKQLLRTPFVACIKNDDISVMVFVFMPSYHEYSMYAVALGMLNVVCCYEYKSTNKIHKE